MTRDYLRRISILLCIIGVLAVNGPILSQGSQSGSMTPSTELMMKITNPSDEGSVSDPVSVGGTILGDIPNDHYVWLLTAPESASGLYWPQGSDHITPVKGLWSWVAYLGGETGNRVGLLVTLVDKGTDQDFRSWAEQGAATGNYQGIRFPDNAKIIDKITVIKK
jgi:hypothetical protein